VERRYKNLKTEVNSPEEHKRNSERKKRRLEDLNNQITEASNYVEHFRASCRQEGLKDINISYFTGSSEPLAFFVLTVDRLW